MLKESEKERTNLLATAFNTLGVNTAIAGFVAPLVAYVFKVGTPPQAEVLLPLFFLWPTVGIVCHVYARIVLSGLDG